MRVVRLITRLNRGGPLRQLEALVPGLARRGIVGPVWTGRPEPGEEDASEELRRRGVEVEFVPGLGRRLDPAADAGAWRWLRRRLARVAPDLLHTHMGKAGALGVLAARAAGTPLVVHTFHGHHFEAAAPWGVLARTAERVLGLGRAASICLTPRQREDLVARHRVASPHRAVVVAPGLDVAEFRARVDPAAVAAWRARLAPDGAPLALWLGRFVPVKRPLLLLEALAHAPAGSVRLVLAGEGPLAPAAHARAGALGVNDRVVFVGAVSAPASLVAACDFAVLASASEGAPLSLLEAMALGRPVLATRVGGVPDLVEEGVNGLLVPSGDAPALGFAMARLAADPAATARMGEEARRAVEARWDAPRLVEATAALYTRLGSGPERGGARARR